MHKIQEMVQPWGIEVSAETKAEAQQGAQHQDTDWEGYNHTGEYYDVNESVSLFEGLPDPNNGQKQSGPAV